MSATRRTTARARAALAGITLLTVAAPRAAAAGVVYSGALQFTSGDYGYPERTNGVYLINALYYNRVPFHVSASVPLVYQNTALVSSIGPGTMPSGGATRAEGGTTMRGGHHTGATDNLHELGLGDPLLRAEWEVLDRRALAASAVVKPPLADADNGFGTGEWDYGAGLSSSGIVRRVFLSASATYWVLGDPAGFDLHDTLAYSFGVGRPWARGRYSALVSFVGYTRVQDGIDPFREIAASIAYTPTPGRSLNAAVSFGIGDSAPDIGLSLGWVVQL